MRSPGKGEAHRPRKRFGQHFLEPPWVARLVEAIAPQRTDTFLEIGPGHGALTMALAPAAGRIVAVEIDRDLARDLARRAPARVEIVTGDFLDIDVPAILAPLRSQPVRVVGNLPYNVTSPILFKLIELHREGAPFSDATLLVQREVADRLAAPPGGRDYGVLSIFVQMHADVSRLITLPPGAFRPKPKVDSTLVRFTFHPPRVAPVSLRMFETLVRTVFMQRRKTLFNALKPLAADLGLRAGPVLAAAGVDPARRPETLDVAEFAAIADVLARPNT